MQKNFYILLTSCACALFGLIVFSSNSNQYARPFFYRDGSYKEPLYYDFYDYGRPYYQYNVTSGVMYGYN